MEKKTVYDWNDVVLLLVAVDLDIKWWRGVSRINLGSLKLAKEERKYQQFLNKVVILGFRRLMPKRYYSRFHNLDVWARELLRSHSYPTAFGYLMSKNAYYVWKEKITAVQNEFYKTKDEILSQWEDIGQDREKEYEKNIKSVWELEIKDKSGKTSIPSELVDKLLELLRARHTIPSIQAIRDSFCFEWNVSYLEPTTSLIMGEKIMEQRRLEFKRLHTTHSPEDIKTVICQNEEEERFHREIVSRVRYERETKIRMVLEQIAVYIPQQIYDSVLDSLASISRNFNKKGENYVIGRVSLGLNNLTEQICLLNFSQDKVINSWGRTIKEVVVNKKPEQRNIEDTIRQLYILASRLREYLISLGKIPRLLPSLEICKDIQPALIPSLLSVSNNENNVGGHGEDSCQRRCKKCNGPIADMNKGEKCYHCQEGVYEVLGDQNF